jgi:hypothetical protein
MSQEEEIVKIIAPYLMGKHKKDKALELAKEIIDHINSLFQTLIPNFGRVYQTSYVGYGVYNGYRFGFV